ncbi:MAG TPA: hypothetical protein VER12_02470 [Polyangiaceae bacterium]|nr:hypothetical protein [Polyangiaceae bacterium]
MSESNSPPPTEPLDPPPSAAPQPTSSPAAVLFPPPSPSPLEPIDTKSLFGLADALLRAPERAMAALNRQKFGLLQLFLLVLAFVSVSGVVLASFSGGWQYLAVPLKFVIVVTAGPLLCLPSLYIFSCLSESNASVRDVTLALGSGLGVQALLLCGLAPVAWVFSQSTNSVGFMGALYLAMYLVSSAFGLGLTRRLLVQDGFRLGHYWLWQALFMVVVLQLSTTLRPIVGPFDGFAPREKLFFAVHWLQSLPS